MYFDNCLNLNKFILGGVHVITDKSWTGNLGLGLNVLPRDSTAFYVNAQRSNIPTSPLSQYSPLFEYPDPASGFRLFHSSYNAPKASQGSCLTYSNTADGVFARGRYECTYTLGTG